MNSNFSECLLRFILGINYMSVDAYRDEIHTNSKGHRILSYALQPEIEEVLLRKIKK